MLTAKATWHWGGGSIAFHDREAREPGGEGLPVALTPSSTCLLAHARAPRASGHLSLSPVTRHLRTELPSPYSLPELDSNFLAEIDKFFLYLGHNKCFPTMWGSGTKKSLGPGWGGEWGAWHRLRAAGKFSPPDAFSVPTAPAK